MEVGQEKDVGDDQTDDHHRLHRDQATEIINLCERMAALFVGVTEVMKNHHYNHKNSVSNREDIEGRPPHVFCLDVELQVALEPGLVMMVMQELVNYQERGPVSPVTVDQK